MRARGMRYEYRRQPRHVMHKEDPLDRGREIVKKKEKAEKGRNGGGGGGGGRVSATERNCTSWDSLIYWVITDLGARRARRARGVWVFSPARESFEISQNGGEECIRTF